LAAGAVRGRRWREVRRLGKWLPPVRGQSACVSVRFSAIFRILGDDLRVFM
jgi:hypothetical protein